MLTGFWGGGGGDTEREGDFLGIGVEWAQKMTKQHKVHFSVSLVRLFFYSGGIALNSYRSSTALLHYGFFPLQDKV